MYTVDVYLQVRLACHVEGISEREAARRFGLARETVRKMLRHAEPPGYRRQEPPKRPKLDRLTHHVHILEMNGESYRLTQSRKRRKSPKTPA